MKKWRRTIGLRDLIHLEEDGAGNLYWRGRRITAADFARAFLATAVIGAVCDLIKTTIGRP